MMIKGTVHGALESGSALSPSDDARPCLFLLDNLGIGGSERKTILVANRLAERGRRVHLVFLNMSRDIGGTIHSDIPRVVLKRRGKLDLRAVGTIRNYVQRHGIETVWAVNLYPMLYAYLATRIPRWDIRLIGSSNVSLLRNRYELLKMYLYKPVMRRLDAFVFGSQRQMDIWVSGYSLGLPEMTVIYNGVLTDRFSPAAYGSDRIAARAVWGLSEEGIVLGNVAQFRVEKAQRDIVEAARLLREKGYPVQVLLVGDGSERPSVEALVRNHGMSDIVRFAGLLDDVRPALLAIDVFVLSSIAVETFSNAALEAMSMGCPAVLSDIGGAREMVTDGFNGYVYQPGNPGALACQLQKMMGAAELIRLGTNARQRVLDRFSADAMADRYEVLIWGEAMRRVS